MYYLYTSFQSSNNNLYKRRAESSEARIIIILYDYVEDKRFLFDKTNLRESLLVIGTVIDYDV